MSMHRKLLPPIGQKLSMTPTPPASPSSREGRPVGSESPSTPESEEHHIVDGSHRSIGRAVAGFGEPVEHEQEHGVMEDNTPHHSPSELLTSYSNVIHQYRGRLKFPILGVRMGKHAVRSTHTSASSSKTSHPRSSTSSQSHEVGVNTSDRSESECARHSNVINATAKALIKLYVATLRETSAGKDSTVIGSPRHVRSPVKSRDGRSQSMLSATPQTPHRKRKLTDLQEAEEASSNRSLRKRRRIRSSSSSAVSEGLLACPFFKYDDFLFGINSSEPSYHLCGISKFVHIDNLKRHLQRNHSAPEHYCFSCCRSDFVSEHELMMHSRDRPACIPREPPLYLERINRSLFKALRLDLLDHVDIGEVDYWYMIFDKMFPGTRKIRTINPYFEGRYRSKLNMFLRFSRLHVDRVVAMIRELTSASSPEPLSSTKRTATIEDRALQLATDLFDYYLTNHGPSRQAVLPTASNSNEPSSDMHVDKSAANSVNPTRDRPNLLGTNTSDVEPSAAAVPVSNFSQPDEVPDTDVTDSIAEPKMFRNLAVIQENSEFRANSLRPQDTDLNNFPREDFELVDGLSSNLFDLSSNFEQSDVMLGLAVDQALQEVNDACNG